MAEEFVVQFVLLDEDDQNQMQRAEEAVRTTANLPTQVINGAAALEITKAQKNVLVVCDPFEGEVYDHLKALKCRIVGPQCVLSCLKLGKAIPKADYPIYTMAMRDVVISCSSVEKEERTTIHELVHLMGGRVAKDFTAMVTHLVAGEVGSKKYHVAVKLEKPIMLPEWIRACWERGKTCHISATDEEFDQYKCPVFQGCVVCVTGLDGGDRQEIRTQVEQYGGRYSGELRREECTHLVAKEPKGAKYEFARKWKLHCVTTKWFYDSLEAGSCQDENLYRLDKTNGTGDNKTSTPSQEKKKAPRFSTHSIADISTISTASSRGNMSHVNETNLNATRLPLDSSRDYGETPHGELDALDVSNIGAGMFLDGFTIFLSGFSGTRLEKLRKIINAGGGMRLNQLNEKVSHVVMSGPDERLAQNLTAENLRPHVVSAKWLVECVKAGKQVLEEPFYCLELPPLDPSSPVQSKKAEKAVPDQPPPPEDKDEDATQMEVEEPADDDIMSQYLAEVEEEEDVTTIEAPQENQEQTEEDDEEVVFMNLEEKQPEEEEDVTVEMDEDCQGEMEEGGRGVFEGKLFSFYSFTETQTATLAEFVGQNGGSVVKSGSRAVPNYAVVPLLGFPEGISAEEIVTDCWLNMCLEQETLLSPEHNPLFTPLTFKPDCMPLVGCVLSLSQYTGVEREFLTGLAEELGACCQEFFVRKAQPSKNLQASTHLLCKTPEGSKYDATRKWKLPAVTSHWVFECGRTGKKLPEERFLVSNVQQQQSQEPVADKTAKKPKTPNQESKPKEAQVNVTPSEAPGPSKDSPGNKENRQEDRRTSTLPKQQISVPSTSAQKKSPSAKEERKSPTEKEDRTSSIKPNAQKPSEPPISKQQDGKKDTSAPSALTKIKTPVLSKEPLASKNKTPVLSKEQLAIKKNKRLTELQKPQVKLDTPSKFLSKGVVFKPSFDMQDAMDALQSPAVVGSQGQRKRARRSSVPLDALLQQNLEKALSNFSKEGNQPAMGMQQGGQGEEEEEEEEEVFTKEPSPPRPLSGVVIYVSKKLSKQQSDYNDLANCLGADYRWTYDESVTHFIFQGRANDTTKEFRTARSQGKTIVSPHWLQVCDEQGARVDETLFPHTYNPKLSLSQAVVSKTPARSTRSSSRRKDSDHQEKQDSTEGEEDREQEEQGQDRPHMEQEGGTLEMRDDFQRQFEEIMSATRVTRSTRRRTKRLNDSTGTPSASDDSAKRFSTRSRTRAPSQTSKGDSKDKLAGQEQTKSAAKCPENFTEASQSIQISWDDPTGRLERERIAEQLRYRASPTQDMDELSQDGQEFLTRMSGETANQEQGPGQLRLPSANNRAASTSPNQGADRSFGEEEPTPTPEGPSIAFPIARPAVPHPPTVTKAQGEEGEEVQKQVYIFQMSGMTPQEKMDYSGLIEELGGEVIDKQTFDPRCSHIVVGNPNRNEKYLSALAMGRWILHRSYMEACREAKAFVEEEPHEWGTATDVSGMPDNVARLALAARRWRQNLADVRARNNDPEVSAFQNWAVLLHVDPGRTSGFKRLLESGGATVLSTRPPHANFSEATHAFIDFKGKGVDQSLDVQALVEAGVWCLKSEYIADYLMQDPIPKPQNFVISEAVPHMTAREEPSGTETPRKRKASSVSGLDGKRSKRL
ncbi:DNA topoisomerase 2-binding protein 1-like [Branchiostoma lanceolatum]|uniref:DNA topoisomerase 2-binding protein 1-like n=1 Tax=Branchiostoma lanceolatum TaxID=7740 RepID=UPI0034572E05